MPSRIALLEDDLTVVDRLAGVLASHPEFTLAWHAASLRDAGFFVPGIRPPSVPDGESLLRISLCYHHTPDMIDALVEQLARLRSANS